MENNLNNRIVKARKKAGISQKTLAVQLDIAYQTLNKYEKGHRIPDADVLRRLANIVHCDPGWLLTGEEKKGEEPVERGPVVSDAHTLYNDISDVAKLIVQVLKDMPEEDQREILKRVKEKKLLKKLMDEQEDRNNTG